MDEWLMICPADGSEMMIVVISGERACWMALETAGMAPTSYDPGVRHRLMD